MTAIPVERDPDAVSWHQSPSTPTIYHPYAELLPHMDDAGYRALREDVRQNGVREPIVMFEGKILDGRHRYLAARDEGVPYPVVEYEGDDPLAYVISLNLHRRHLSESQRAMVAGKMAKLPPRRPSKSAPIEALSQSDAAALLNVGRSAVQRAATVRDHGAPSLITAVETGQVSVSAAAEVARLPEEEQVEIVGQGPAAVKATARELREAVVAGAMRGLRGGGQRTSRKNPEYNPDPKFGAMATVSGACRTIIETVDKHDAAFVVGGFHDDAMRDRNLVTFRHCRDILNSILEAADVRD